MRSVTTVLANKSVLLPCSDGIAMQTGLRRIARVNEDHFDTRSTSFVHYLLLKLPEGPAVQACANLLPGLDSLADVRKIFKNDQANIAFCRIFNNGLADFVVDLFHMSFLSAGSLSKCLSGASGAIALETSPTAQVFVTVVLHLPGFEDSAGRQCGGVVFANINAHDLIQRQVVERYFLEFLLYGNVQLPSGRRAFDAALPNEVAFAKLVNPILLRRSGKLFSQKTGQLAQLKLSRTKTNADTPIHRIDRRLGVVVEEANGVLVQVNNRIPEADAREHHLLILREVRMVADPRLVHARHRTHDVAGELCTKNGHFGSNHRISGLVQVVPLPEPFFPICIGHDDWDEQIAGLPVEATGLMHLFGSIGIDLQGNADGTHVDFASNELTCAL